MLSLKPPYLASGNLVLFQDDVDSSCFYYVNQLPHISLDSGGKPALSAYSILPESGANVSEGAILEAGLNLDVDLGVTEEELEAARKAIQKSFGVDAKILSPAPLHNGKVRFVMAQAGEEPDSSNWFVTSEVTPSLVGSNRVSLAIRTSGREAKMMIAAANEGTIPACIYYELELIGITPVYHAWMQADMRKTYHYLKDYKEDNFIFYTEEIDKVIQKLEEEKALVVEVEETDPDIKAEAMASLFNDLKKQVIDKFFEPVTMLSEDSGSKSRGILDQLGDAVTGILHTLIPARHILKRTIDEEQLKVLTVDLSQKNAKTFPFCPQAFLKAMVEDAGIDMSERIDWISLDDLPYFTPTVSVRIAADTFESSNINALLVTCRIVDEETGEIVMAPESCSFSAKEGKSAWDFNFNRQRGRKYGYEYRVSMFMTTGSNLLPDKLETDWIRQESSYIYINPAVYYRDFDLDLNLSDLTVFEQAQMIQADVSVVHRDSEEVVLEKQFIFNKDDYAHRKMTLVVGRDLPLAYNVRLVYFLPGAKEHSAEYKGIRDTFYFIPNPFENRWSVDLVCKADWTSVAKVYLDTRIRDAEREDFIVNNFIFSSNKEEARIDASVSLDTPPRCFEYLVTRYDVDGGTVRAGWFKHEDSPLLVVNPANLKEESFVRFFIDNQAAWDKLGIKNAKVELKYPDGSGEEIKLQETMKAPDEVVEFKYPRGTKPSYRLRLADEDNVTHNTGWEEVKGDEIRLIVSSDNW